MNRTSVICGTLSKDLTHMYVTAAPERAKRENGAEKYLKK